MNDQKPAEPAPCPMCKGSGTIRSMTSHLGPDDYEFDEECPACWGTGSADPSDAVNALGWWTHLNGTVVARYDVLRLIKARDTARNAGAVAPPPAEPARWVPPEILKRAKSLLKNNGGALSWHRSVLEWVIAQSEAGAPPPEPAPQYRAYESTKRVYLVPTGETHEGVPTFTRWDNSPPPLSDSELLYAWIPFAHERPSAPVAPSQPAEG